jgi:triacylglycerol lipase
VRLRSRPVAVLVAALAVLAALAVTVIAVACGQAGVVPGQSGIARGPAGDVRAQTTLRCASPAHPYPVVLVPGTFDATSWTTMARALRANGDCVKQFDYNTAGVGPIAGSARALGQYVDRVLATTHASRVSIVAHSQGGIVARYYVRFLGGASKVKDLVALAPPNYGTTTPLVIPGAVLGCAACAQQAAGSNLLARLNAGDPAPGPVDYTNIETRYDAVVTPFQSAFLPGPASRVTNVVLQNSCPDDMSGHLSITDDPAAVQWVEDALGSHGPANPAFRPRC